MSDRPMRLKYLTKMKISLCIFLLYITAVSVFSEPQELNGIVGKSIEFPAAVKIEGSLRYGTLILVDVTSDRFMRARSEKFNGRMHWNSSTGYFSLSALKMEDIGEYEVQNTDQKINTVFQLNVYIPVLKPHVNVTHDEYPCTLLCSVERGTGVTLSWYREGEEKPYVTLPVRNHPYLDLPVPVERSGTYTCEAKNSVSIEKASITVGAHCTAPASPSTGTIVPIIIAVVASVIAVVAILVAVVFAVLFCRNSSKHPTKDAVGSLIQEEEMQALRSNGIRSKHPEEEMQALRSNGIRSKHPEEMQALRSNDEANQGLIQDGNITSRMETGAR